MRFPRNGTHVSKFPAFLVFVGFLGSETGKNQNAPILMAKIDLGTTVMHGHEEDMSALV